MNSNYLTTVGIACFNAESTIQAAIRSALSQDWPELDVLVADDASSDQSVAIIEAETRRDARVRLIRHDINRGVGAIRNTLVQHARGEFLAFFDDDDTSSASRIREQIQRIERYETATNADRVICHAARHLHLPDGRYLYEPALGAGAGPAPAGRQVIDLILLGEPVGPVSGSAPTCSQMARRRVYLEVGGFDESLRRSEDTEFNLRAAAAGAHFTGIAEALVEQHLTPGSEKSLLAEQEATLRILEKHRNLLDERGLYKFASRWLQFKHAILMRRYGEAARLGGALAATRPIRTGRRIWNSLPNREPDRAAAAATRNAARTSQP